MAVHSNTPHYQAESGWGNRANVSATPRHWRFGSPASTRTWRVTRNRWMTMHTVAHAWCVRSNNVVVDPTWDEGAEYFGVPFQHDYLRRVLKARRDYGLI